MPPPLLGGILWLMSRFFSGAKIAKRYRVLVTFMKDVVY